MAKLLELTKGQFSEVDDEDFERFKVFRWYAFWNPHNRSFYAIRKTRDNKTIFLHREILGLTNPKIQGDHINHDTLNNKRSNLRAVTISQNQRNRKGAQRNSKSGIRGVHWFKRDKCWRAYIMVNYKFMHLGYFDNLQDAAKAYAKANKKYFGEFGGNYAWLEREGRAFRRRSQIL